MNNWIYAYYQGILDGTYLVNKWVRVFYEYIIRGIENKQFFYNPKKAKAAIVFVENFCRHHEGALAPQKIKLEVWQKAFLCVVFGIYDDAGNRQFREIVLVVARKNGKTLFAAAIAAYCMYMDGEYGARIYFAAPKLEQAGLCFDAFQQIIYREPALNEITKKRRTDVYVEETNSSAKPIAFNHKKSDGLNCFLGVNDELASWTGDAGLKFYEVIKSSMGARRQPLLLNITTAGYINDGIYDELIKRSTRFLLGDSGESRLAPFLYMIDDIDKWNDINELRKSNPNLGVSVTVDYMLEEIAIAEGSLSKRNEFIVKYCCLKQNSSMAWLDTQTIDKTMGEPLSPELFRGCYCVGGFDLSRTTDLTSACVVIEKGGELYVLSRFWLPSERIQEAQQIDGVPYEIYVQRGLLCPSGANAIDYNDLFDWFRELVEEYELFPLQVGYDHYSANYLVQQMESYGFHLDNVYQGFNLHPVIQEVEGLLKDGKIHIGDNDLLKIHFYNSALKVSTEKGKSKLVKINPTAHIDGMAALLDAMTVRQKWYGQIGEQLKNED